MTDSIVTNDFREIEEFESDTHEELLRLTDAVYDDGIGEPRQNDPDDPNFADAEQVAFQVFTQGDVDIPNDFDLSALWIFWGQFTDHNLDLTLEEEGAEAELLKEAGPLSVTRSEHIFDEDGVRQHENVLTPELDGFAVYAGSEEELNLLRTLDGDGKLKTGVQGADGVFVLPSAADVSGDPNAGDLFIAGDRRQGENPGLSSIHTLFVNEHNYWADYIAEKDPSLSGEEIFQQARALVESFIQKITYEEFLPVLLGDALEEYSGFDETVDTQVSTEFQTAAFRFGHTAIPNSLTFLDEDGSNSNFEATIIDIFTGQPTVVNVAEDRGGELGLLDVFDNQTIIENGGVATVLRGVLEERAQKIDSKVVDGLNLFLFTPDGGLTGFSLPERNILRGRDHGIDTYVNVRAALVGDIDPDTLDPTDFSIITSDLQVQADLASVYDTVFEVDLWVGGIVEDHVPGTTLGVTFQTIVADQFNRNQAGDEYFYLNREFSEEFQEIIENTQLSDILQRSGGVEHVQRDALLASERTGGDEGADDIRGDDGRDLLIGFGGADRLRGRDGDDDLFGDEGADNLLGQNGDDGLFGGDGADKLNGGNGDDELDGGEGADNLLGKDGDDVIFGGAGDDKATGGDGDDIIEGGDGDDVLMGQGGDDVIEGGNGFDTIRGGDGEDVIVFNVDDEGFDFVKGFEEEDVLDVSDFNVTFADLDIVRDGNSVILSINDDVIAQIKGRDAKNLEEDDFIF